MDVAMATLPASWRTLYALSTLTAEQFQRGLDTGVIRPRHDRLAALSHIRDSGKRI
jgi:hypothetical protein